MNQHTAVLDIPGTLNAYLALNTGSGFIPEKGETMFFRNDFAILKNAPGITVCHPVKTDYYNITLCLKGSCKKTMGHFTFEVYPSSIHLVSPGYVHSSEKASADLHFYQILFKKEFLTDSFLKENILDNLLEINSDYAPIYGMSASTFQSIQAIYDKINEEINHSGLFHLQIIKLLVVELLYQLNRVCEKCLLSSGRHLNKRYQLVLKFKKLIDEQFLTLKTVQEYADLLFVSAKHLTQIVKSETGENALHLVHKRLFLEARYLLSSSTLSIKEIAKKLNFDNSSHFSRFFKRYSGTNPSMFKSA